MSPTNKTSPPSTTKPPQPSKITAALAVLAESYEHRRSTSLAALRAREAEIAERVHSLVDSIETTLAVPQGDDASALRDLLGPEQITSYTRAAQAARAIAAIVEAESAPAVAPSPGASPVAPSGAPTPSAPPKTAEPGTVSLAGPNKWNVHSLRKASIAAATAAGWPADKLAMFTASVAAVKKYAEVLGVVRASGLQVVE